MSVAVATGTVGPEHRALGAGETACIWGSDRVSSWRQPCVGFGILLLPQSHQASPAIEASQPPGSSPESFRKKPLFC